MKSLRLLAVLAAMLLIFVTSAFGESYIVIKNGFYNPFLKSIDQNGNRIALDFNSGYSGELAIGKYLTPNFSLEGGVGYFSTEASETYSRIIRHTYLGYVTQHKNDDIRFRVIPVTVTAKMIAPIENVELFVGGGLGRYFTKAGVDVSVEFYGDDSYEDSLDIFGFHLMAGANVKISEKTFIGFEGKNIWIDKATYSGSLFGNYPLPLKADLEGFVITGNVGFKF